MNTHFITSDLLEDEPDMIDLVNKFISRLPELQQSVSIAYRDQNWDEFSSVVHQLKGVGGAYGYPMLTTQCEQIEVSVKSDDKAQLEKHFSTFMQMCENILAGKDENLKIVNRTNK